MRFESFRSSVEKDRANRVSEVTDLIEFAFGREDLSDKIKVDDFPVRVVHNDTKLNNVLLHKSSGEGMCVVDLDTVMPGCSLHDFGDLVRTAACSALEDEVDLDKVRFLPEVFGAIVEGYLESAGDMLEPSEIDHMALAPQVITYELGLRFWLIIWMGTFISRSSAPATTSTVRELNSSFCPQWKNISPKWRKS